MVFPENWLFEAIKLAAQLGGALLVAWLAVRWALVRYKREKAWDRRLQAYADLVQVLGDMISIQQRWINELEGGGGFSEDYSATLSKRYDSARFRLDEARSNAMLLLPDETNGTVTWLLSSLDQVPDDEGPYTYHTGVHESLNRALDQLLEQGRTTLGVY